MIIHDIGSLRRERRSLFRGFLGACCSFSEDLVSSLQGQTSSLLLQPWLVTGRFMGLLGQLNSSLCCCSSLRMFQAVGECVEGVGWWRVMSHSLAAPTDLCWSTMHWNWGLPVVNVFRCQASLAVPYPILDHSASFSCSIWVWVKYLPLTLP